MSVLPSFKAAFSSLADDSASPDDNNPALPRTSAPQPITSQPQQPLASLPTPLHARPPALQRGGATSAGATSAGLTPLPLDLVSGDAPAFGFARLPRIDDGVGAPVDRDDGSGGGGEGVKRPAVAGPAVHAGAYKRPRATSVSGGSYVKLGSQASSEKRIEDGGKRVKVDRGWGGVDSGGARASSSTRGRNGLVSYFGGGGGFDVGGIIEDSTCRVGGRDVLSSPVQRSNNSGGLLRGVSLRGPTASDLSMVLGGKEGSGEEGSSGKVKEEEEEGGKEAWRQGGGSKGKEEEGSVQCPHCSRRLMNQVTLQNHVRVVHDHSGNFRCEQCGFTFMWRSTLLNHVRLVHEKQRPYACDECAKAFRWKSHLKEHIWVVHKNEKPFKCETCGKTFGRKNNMQKHMRKHNNSN